MLLHYLTMLSIRRDYTSALSGKLQVLRVLLELQLSLYPFLTPYILKTPFYTAWTKVNIVCVSEIEYHLRHYLPRLHRGLCHYKKRKENRLEIKFSPIHLYMYIHTFTRFFLSFFLYINRSLSYA